MAARKCIVEVRGRLEVNTANNPEIPMLTPPEDVEWKAIPIPSYTRTIILVLRSRKHIWDKEIFPPLQLDLATKIIVYNPRHRSGSLVRAFQISARSQHIKID